MENRWLILAILFIARTAMAYQFQSVASVSTFIIEQLDIDYTRFGALIGAYMIPGIALAFPGGSLGKHFEDKSVVLTGLSLMAIGGFLMGLSNSFSLAFTGRLISGIGAVILNVFLAKMVTDWFVGREIVTGMAILVTSWPLGIALALMSLPQVATAKSWQLAMQLTAIVSLAALLLVGVFYRSPGLGGNGAEKPATGFSRQEVLLVTVAGLVWTLFNVGFVMLPSFAPAFLISSGYSIASAGSLVSVVTWIVIPAIPFGGYVAERLGWPNLTMVACFFGVGSAMCLLPFVPLPLTLLLAVGLLFGPPAGIIMSLPAEALHPANRAPGMGVFYTCYYFGMAALPPIAGLSRDLTGSPGAPILFGGMLLFVTIILLGLFRHFQTCAGGG